MIVVGVDGSRAGLEAVSWAVKEAALRGVPLRIVHAMPKWAYESRESSPYANVGLWMREGAESVVEEALQRARREAPDVVVEHELLPGDPRPALFKAAEGAEMLVVGNHGLGGFRGLRLGSVALGVIGHTTCPAVVVRGVPTPPRDEVVVGVDGYEGSTAAIRFAFAEAALRGAELRAVQAWNALLPATGLDPMPPTEQDMAERRLLSEALAGWSERYPDVKVTARVEAGHPVEVLRRASAGADLLVVGSHGRGDVSGLLVGSVSHALLHHAVCPLAVVPEARRGGRSFRLRRYVRTHRHPMPRS
jgi:nucleotide-binding universal stress UspA family protein